VFFGLEIPYRWARVMESYFGLCESFIRYQCMMYGAWRESEEEIKRAM